jgi:hypothetical protein
MLRASMNFRPYGENRRVIVHRLAAHWSMQTVAFELDEACPGFDPAGSPAATRGIDEPVDVSLQSLRIPNHCTIAIDDRT